jgi:parallel beta-helix repeat protein
LSAGAGSVSVYDNLIQSNLAGSGNGGGLAAMTVNGQDVENAVSVPADYYLLDIYNNIIVNNVAAFRGGGIYLQDVARGQVLNNTVVNNDSTATAADAFIGAIIPTQTVPQGAGIVANAHSSDLAVALTNQGTPQTFANPTLENNIIWNNRSYLRDATLNGGLGDLVFDSFWDVQVTGTPTPELLDPQFCILTDGTGYNANNIVSDPLVVSEYVNTLFSAGAGDEGGNFINVTPSPLGLDNGDYHITSGSPARDAGTANVLTTDFDGDVRPDGGGVDIGADEFYTPATVLYQLTVDVFGTGTGTVTSSPVGISCGGDCIAEYTDGTAVILTATPDANTLFIGWSGAGCSGTETCEVTMDADQAVTATFRSFFTSLLGLYDHGAWTLDTNGNNIREPGDATFNFGIFSDLGIVGDWNGDGTTEVGVFRQGTWRLDTNGNEVWEPGTDIEIVFGLSTDKPVMGDWNGDGTTDIGVYRKGWWFLDSDGVQGWNPGTDTTFKFGLNSDKPVTGDWNGDGTTDVGVVRNNVWYLDSNGVQGWNSGSDTVVTYGRKTDIPVTGDWNADGTTDIGVYRLGWWYLDSDGILGWTTGSDSAFRYGTSGELPVTGIW